MASLNTLRTKFGIVLSIVIAGALLAFILSLKTEMGFSGNDPRVGVINGKKINYSEYYNQYEQIKAQSGAQESDEQQSAMLANAAWQALIGKYVLEPGFDKMGLRVTEPARLSLLSGPHPSQAFYNAFADPRTGEYNVAAVGQGLLVYLAAQKKKEGLTLSQLGDWVEDNKLHVCHWFTVDDLNFLKRGGRVSAATALVGTMLSIKPVMHTDNEGRLTLVDKARGRKASLKALLDAIERLAIEPEKQTMFICHADCEEEAKQVAAEIQRRFGTTDIRIHYIGPVIGSHTGPNTMGLFFVGTER